ncbi:MAG: hypothetical protein JJT89_02455 [Nitriliruptoraceae bacterium]|nr:hypothetical protein [Nitriliruptoraceae bacterium]
MNTTRTLAVLVGAALLSLALVAGPAFASDDLGASDPVASATDDATVLAVDSDHERRALADSPRSRVALLLYGALFAGAVYGWIGMRRQLKGDHPKASGEFRWR